MQSANTNGSITTEGLLSVAKRNKTRDNANPTEGRCSAVRREGNLLHCSIQDDGIGFDPDRVWSGAARGLGLIGMRERLARLGATLEVRSRADAGTRIAIAFPLARTHVDPVDSGR